MAAGFKVQTLALKQTACPNGFASFWQPVR